MARKITVNGSFPYIHYATYVKDSLNKEDRDFYYKIIGGDLQDLDLADTQKLVRKGYVTNPHVYSVLNNLLTSALQIPWQVYQVRDKNVFKTYQSLKSSGQLEKALEIEHKAVDIFDGENELTKLIANPNKYQTFEEVVNTLLAMRYLTGDSIMYGVGTGLESRPGLLEIIPLPSQYVKVMTSKKWFGEVTGYELKLGENVNIAFNLNEIMHIKNFNPLLNEKDNVITLGVRGQSPLAPLCHVIEQSNDGYRAQMAILKHGHPLGIISNNSNEPMTDGEWTNAQNMMQKSYGGAGNKGKIKMTTANLKWLNMGFNSVDMQLTEQQNISLSAVCAAYGLPAPNVTGQNANFNTGKEAEKQKWNDAILPHLSIIQQHLNRYFHAQMPNLDKNVFVDYDHRSVPSLQQDLEKLTKIILSQLHSGLMDLEEANRILLNDVKRAEHHNKYLLSNQLRFSDQLPPGQTGVGDNNNNNDNA